MKIKIIPIIIIIIMHIRIYFKMLCIINAQW
jgi:hypothetical protein